MSKNVLLLGLIMLVAGCGGSGAELRYYVIDPVESGEITNLSGSSIQILDIRLPQYLERFQIARRESNNQLSFAANHQWGENLRKNLYRTMTVNLSNSLGTADVGSSISRSLSTPDYLVRLSIEAFEQGADGRVLVAARYQVSHQDGELLASHHFKRVAERDSGNNYGAMVEDLQVLFAELCLEVSESIQRLEAQHAG